MRPRRGSPAAAEGHEPLCRGGSRAWRSGSSEAGKPYLTQVHALQLHHRAGAAGLGDLGTDLEHCQVQLSPAPRLMAVGRQGDRRLTPGRCGGSEGIGQGSGCPAGLGAGGRALGPLHHPLQPLALPASPCPPLGAPAGRAQHPSSCPASCLSCGLPPSAPSEEELPRGQLHPLLPCRHLQLLSGPTRPPPTSGGSHFPSPPCPAPPHKLCWESPGSYSHPLLPGSLPFPPR